MQQLNEAIEGVAEFNDFIRKSTESPAQRLLREKQEERVRELQKTLEAELTKQGP